MAVGGLVTSFLPYNTYGSLATNKTQGYPLELKLESDWEQWPNLDWICSEYWGNRLQCWKIIEGKTTCVVSV
jgi:alkaline phosphatase D